MKWKKHAKRTATTTSAILLAIMLTACSDNLNPKNTPTPAPNETQGTVPAETLPTGSGLLDPGAASNEDTNEQQSDNDNVNNQDNDETTDATPEVKEGTGIYVGAIDGRSIEIEVDQEYMVFQIGPEFQYIINDFDGNIPVTFEYTTKKVEDMDIEQNWITSIEEIKS